MSHGLGGCNYGPFKEPRSLGAVGCEKLGKSPPPRRNCEGEGAGFRKSILYVPCPRRNLLLLGLMLHISPTE